MFQGKKITVGITGGIAAYKAAELVSYLVKNGADVQVVMTEGACQMISPVTLKALSCHTVATDIFALDDSFHVPHIDVAECDLLLIVPATANIIAKIAHGIADDLLSAAVLAATCPIVVAAAMNVNMYNNPATQENLQILAKRGFYLVEPGEGRLACGTTGKGRLAELEEIVAVTCRALSPQKDLAGYQLLLTAGPTWESIDPVRYIGNRSSGKMGYALAVSARNRGAKVTVVSGPVNLPAPSGIEIIKVESAWEMQQAVEQAYEQADIFIAAAAVADYRPKNYSKEKIKKSPEEFQLELEANPDILAAMGKIKDRRIVVGFAAETENLQEYAVKKLKAKNLDLIVANNVAVVGAGFSVDTNIITTITSDGMITEWPLMTKQEAAEKILDCIMNLERFQTLSAKKER